jgi:hypothetical protein
MANTCFQLFRSASHRLTLQLSGDLDEAVALHCEREMRADLMLVVRPSLRVLWDLSALRSYSLESRVVVVRMQQFLSTKALRTAYVANTPAARSLALWAARMGGQCATHPGSGPRTVSGRARRQAADRSRDTGCQLRAARSAGIRALKSCEHACFSPMRGGHAGRQIAHATGRANFECRPRRHSPYTSLARVLRANAGWPRRAAGAPG